MSEHVGGWASCSRMHKGSLQTLGFEPRRFPLDKHPNRCYPSGTTQCKSKRNSIGECSGIKERLITQRMHSSPGPQCSTGRHHTSRLTFRFPEGGLEGSFRVLAVKEGMNLLNVFIPHPSPSERKSIDTKASIIIHALKLPSHWSTPPCCSCGAAESRRERAPQWLFWGQVLKRSKGSACGCVLFSFCLLLSQVLIFNLSQRLYCIL